MLTVIPCIVLSYQYLDARIFFSTYLEEVNEQLFHAKSYEEMIDTLDKFVARIRPVKAGIPFDNIADHMLNNEKCRSLDWLACQSSLSVKQFERNFKLRTGVSPKTFLRIAHFNGWNACY